MEVNYARLKLMPHFVKVLCMPHDAWVVGSAARYLVEQEANMWYPHEYRLVLALPIRPLMICGRSRNLVIGHI